MAPRFGPRSAQVNEGQEVLIPRSPPAKVMDEAIDLAIERAAD
jgi:hypothetical protein